MATLANPQDNPMTFWQKMSLGMSAFIVFGFAQFALRGFVNYEKAPLVMHLHGLSMLAWLALLCTQSMLAGGRGRGALALHRNLGLASVVLLPLIVALTSLTCLTALPMELFPPFFTPAYFLALAHVGIILFAVVVILAIALRRAPGWHRRLMAGSTILLLDPALGRVLPMPLIVPWGGWLAMAIELGLAALIIRYDRRVLGHIHPATGVIVVAVALNHLVVELLAIFPPWIAFTQSLTTSQSVF